MNLYVLITRNRQHVGKYVAVPGAKKSFTSALERAQTFATFEAALRNACGDEFPVAVHALLPTPEA